MKRWVIGFVAALSWAVVANAAPLDLVSNEKLAEQMVAQAILSEIYRQAGLTVTVTPLPPARANVEATRGDHDGEVARIESYGTRFPTMVAIRPAYYRLTTSVFALRDSKLTIRSTSDLSSLRVAVINGVAHSADATATLRHVDRVPDADSMFKMLAAGRVDVVLDTGINGAFTVRKLGLTNVVEVGVLAKLDLFHYVHEKNRALVPLLEATLARLAKSGQLASLVARAEQDYLSGKLAP